MRAKILFTLVLFQIFVLNSAEFRKERQLFVTQFQNKTIDLNVAKNYQQQLRKSILEHLKELPKDVRNRLEADSKKEYENGTYPQLTAWDFLEYTRNGDRMKYEAKISQRNRRLSLLVVGHLLSEAHDLKSSLYVDEIVNGVWMILEDSTWSWPATMNHLPGPNEIYIDLGAGEMAKQLSWTKLLMFEVFEQLPNAKINERIDDELKKRIFLPYLNYNWYWNGLQHPNASVNNWNIWINSNILKAAVFTINYDGELLNKVVQKTIKSVDVFVDNYGDDGGCEEGPLYWLEAGGRLIQYVFTLINIHPETREYFAGQALLKSIGQYSWKLRIYGHWFVNFADSIPTIIYPPSMVYLYGKLFNDPEMKEYSSFLYRENVEKNFDVQNLDDFLDFLQVQKEIAKYKPKAPEPEIVSLPDLQIAATRSSKNKNMSKLYLAGKMGNNYESHSHNDIGSFVVFQNNSPVLIDIGVGTYNSKTFGPERYSLFYTKSENHNCPTINGFNQHQGRPYGSTKFSTVIAGDESFVTIRGNLKEAYPAEAKIHHWERIIHFERNFNEIKIQDYFSLEQYLAPHRLNFITVENMTLTKISEGLLLENDNVNVTMMFDWKIFDFENEIISLENDTHLTDVWGDNVQKFVLITKPNFTEVYSWLSYVFKTN